MMKINKFIILNFIFFILSMNVFSFEERGKNKNYSTDVIMIFKLKEINTSQTIHEIIGEVFYKQNTIKITHYLKEKLNSEKVTKYIEFFPIANFSYDYIKTVPNDNEEYIYIDFEDGTSVRFCDKYGSLNYIQEYTKELL